MNHKNQHYYSSSPDSNIKIHSVAESLRRHLYIFKTVTGIFSFKKLDLGTKIFIEHMTIPEDESVLLDLGCGYGAIGIVLAYLSKMSQVYLIDVNKRAIWCTRENIKTNIQYYKGRVYALTGSFFEPIKGKDLKFNGIYMNPPIRIGRKEFFKVCDQIPSFLAPNGFFQFVIRKKMGADFVFKHLKEKFSAEKIEIVCKRSGYWVFKCFLNE